VSLVSFYQVWFQRRRVLKISVKQVKIICQNLKNILTPSSSWVQDTHIPRQFLTKFGQNPNYSFGDTKVDRETDGHHFPPLFITKTLLGVNTSRAKKSYIFYWRGWRCGGQ